MSKSEDVVALFGVYSVRDEVAEEYGPPFLAKNDGVAQRQFLNSFIHAIQSKGAQVSDFTLWCIGKYNSLEGELMPAKLQQVYVSLPEVKK